MSLLTLILGGHARESIYGFKLCCCFSLSIGVCIDVNFSCLHDDWQLHLTRVNQLHICYCLHVAVRLQLLEMSSITTLTKQF